MVKAALGFLDSLCKGKGEKRFAFLNRRRKKRAPVEKPDRYNGTVLLYRRFIGTAENTPGLCPGDEWARI